MHPLDALRQAVLASPDDDLSRLVFADYLEENGEPERAHFIRVQVELAKTPEYEPLAVLGKTRRRDWVTGERWRTQLAPLARGPLEPRWAEQAFRRGFGWSVFGAYLSDLERVVPYLLAHEPVGELAFSTAATLDQWRQFATSPWLSHFTSLAFTGLNSPNEPLRALRDSPHLGGVTQLHLEHTYRPSMSYILGELFATPLGKQLTALSMRLGYSNDIDETLESMAEGGGVNLSEYDLYRMGFGPAAARVFTDTGLAGRTDILRLNGNPVLDGGVRILSTASDQLRVLELAEAMLDESAADALAQSPGFRSLRKLVLTSNPLGTDAIKLIARSPYLAGLRSLGLANTRCDNAAVRYLTRGACWPNLVELDLRNNPISDAGAAHLLTAQPAPDLTSLILPTRNMTYDMKGKLKAKFGDAVGWAE